MKNLQIGIFEKSGIYTAYPVEIGFNEFDLYDNDFEVVRSLVGGQWAIVDFSDLSHLLSGADRDIHWHTLDTWQPEVSYENATSEDAYGVSELLLLNICGVVVKGYFCSSDFMGWFANEDLEDINLDTHQVSFASIKGSF